MNTEQILLQKISTQKILCEVGDRFVSYKAGRLYTQSRTTNNPTFLISLPNKYPVIGNQRLTERILRSEPRGAVAIGKEDFIISYQGAIYHVDIKQKTIELDHRYIAGMNNPLSFCCVGKRIIYGEYYRNPDKGSVAIYERISDKNWQKKFEFAPGMVVHIHRIVFDPYRNCFWILTGDADTESGIWMADVEFRSVKPLLVGCQRYRSCLLLPEKDGVTYITDTPLESNAVYFSQYKNGMLLEPQCQRKIQGPCIYGRILDNGDCIFATSVEPDSSLFSMRYRFTSKLGKGVQDRFVHLIYGSKKVGFSEVASFKKDWWIMWLFQFGNLQFANTEEIIVTGQSIVAYDGCSLLIDGLKRQDS